MCARWSTHTQILEISKTLLLRSLFLQLYKLPIKTNFSLIQHRNDHQNSEFNKKQESDALRNKKLGPTKRPTSSNTLYQVLVHKKTT